MSAPSQIAATLKEAAQLHAALSGEQIEVIAKIAEAMTRAMREGKKVVWFGNGGSATQSQHMAGEFVGRFLQERRPLPSISLTENMASVTAIGNDYAFEQIFSRQLEGLAQPGDVAVGLSTSGNSPNVVKALQKAKTMQVTTVGLTGGTGGQMATLCDLCLCVPSRVTARIQEVHLTVGHILCGLVEDALLKPPAAAA
jgi:D-sedoheptulose 7-phosphate isomerase